MYAANSEWKGIKRSVTESIGIRLSHGTAASLWRLQGTCRCRRSRCDLRGHSHNFHHAGVLLALNAGKQVLVEKPIALNRFRRTGSVPPFVHSTAAIRPPL